MSANHDTRRLDRILADNEGIVVEVNRYGKGAAGNSMVGIETREDIDAVLKMEAERLCKKTSHEILGGTYGCYKDAGHTGRHVGESGDPMDFGVHGDWEIVNVHRENKS